MQKKSFFKDLIRSIYKSKARFLSILAIIAIGVGFYAGINATEPDMILSADKYYRDKNLSDFRIISPLGFTEKDIKDIRSIEGVDKIQKGYSKDLFLSSYEGNISTIKLFSYDHKDFKNSSGINIPIIKEGRMPEKSGEMVVEYGVNVPEEIKVGSEVTLSLPSGEKQEDFIKNNKFTIVGIVDSPLYINFERGQTNIGDGSIDFFAYINEDDFSMERITDLFIATQDSQKLRAYSKEYKDHLVPMEKLLNDLGIKAMTRETQELRDELNKGKKELESEKRKAERDLANAEKELLVAEREISRGERELKENRIKYTKELEDNRTELEKGKEELEKGKVLYQENYEKWLEGYEEYNIGMSELNDAKAQLETARIQLEGGEAELSDAKAQLEGLEEAIVQLENIRKRLVDNPDISQEEFNRLVDEVNFIPIEVAIYLKEAYKYIDDDASNIIIIIDMTISTLEEEFKSGKEEYEAGLKELNKNKNFYEKSLKEYQAGLKELNDAKVSIEQGEIELAKAKADIKENERKLAEGEAALIQGQKELDNSLEEARLQLAEARVELAQGWETFEEEKKDALQKIEDAQEEIKDAERKILEIPKEWFVLDRDGNPGYAGYGDDAQRIGAVAKVFPLFFFLVAALVCLTTMTRMIEEERGQIGTMKALGYNTITISSKYLIYALLSSLIGALLGLSVGFKLFPIAIMNAYGIMYKIPERIAVYHYNYAIISILMAVITTVAASLLATLQELRSTPAMLLQPKAPRPGKRIFLERITPLWKRLSFSHKVTARNIFRYKRRFLMTVIGIAGCTALLLTGFGLRNSINDIMDIQFDEIFIYDGQVVLDTDKDEDERELGEILGQQKDVTSYLRTLNQSVNALVEGSGRSYDVNLLVPEDTEDFKEFFKLQERRSKNKIELSLRGAVISEKLAELINVDVGDTFKYRDSDNINYEIKVDAIAENYLSHYIYMSPDYYDQITLTSPKYNSGVFNIEKMESINEQDFKERLIEHKGVMGVMFTEGIASEVLDTMESLDYVVWILIISAGALAFVVLYNLTNINITERIREIATIKVLGFRDKEVSTYVYRENLILTIIGTLVGLVLGLLLHGFVIGTMEIDAMMFGKSIHLISFIFSIILTMFFSLLVNFFMYFKLRSVNMVESLKSIE